MNARALQSAAAFDSVHVSPSVVNQTSCLSPPESLPPRRYMPLSAEMMEAPTRPDHAAAAVTCRQSTPFVDDQTSFSVVVPFAARPPITNMVSLMVPTIIAE